MICITNGNIVGENEILNGYSLIIDNGYIKDITKDISKITCDVIDAKKQYIMPGFIDIHNHGGDGNRFFEDPSKAYINHLKNGTTSLLATFAYAVSEELLLEKVIEVRELIKLENNLIGINLEGPYINPNYGANTRNCRKANKKEYEKLYNEANGSIKIWMCSPEIENIDEFIDFVESKDDVVLCVGHTECSANRLKELVPKGLKLICHLYDAMGPKERACKAIHEVGTAEAVLVNDDLYAELIPDEDEVHVDSLLLQLAVKAKGIDKVICITDASGEIGKDGKDVTYNEYNELAGSCLTMNKALKNLMKHTGISLIDTIKTGTINPAIVLGIEKEVGSIKKGKKADIVIADKDFNIFNVFLNGKQVEVVK